MAPLVLSTFVIVVLQDLRKGFSFLLTNWLHVPWFFSRGRLKLAFSFFLTYNFSFSSGWWFEILLSLVPGGFFFFFFLVPWMLVDIRLVYIYIYIYGVFQKNWNLITWPILVEMMLNFNSMRKNSSKFYVND